MNGFTFTYSDLLALANTTGATMTTQDLNNDKNYQERKAEIIAENNAYNNMLATMKAANTNLSDDDAKILVEHLGFRHTDITKFENDCLAELQKAVNETAKEQAYENAKSAYENFMTAMGFNNTQQPQQVINLNAMIPQPAQPQPTEETELDEKHMSFQDRCELIESMMSGGSGHNQFRKHLSVRHQNVEVKSIIKDWYKSGYITLAEKNSLLFLANINACSNHLNVTARR